MPRCKKNVCRVCGRIYVRNSGVVGWCQPHCYMQGYEGDGKAKRRGNRTLSTTTPFGSPECWRPLPKCLGGLSAGDCGCRKRGG